MPGRVVPLTPELVQFLAHDLATKTMSWDEPIPAFETRFPNVLESCLATPFQSFGAEPLYPSLTDKAAILFYLLIKNHPFQNGNKRVAVASLLIFLFINKHWLSVDNQKLYRFAVWVAESIPEVKDEVVAAIKLFIDRSLLPMPPIK